MQVRNNTKLIKKMKFTNDCKKCKRLDAYLTEIRANYPEYYGRPVDSWGILNPKLLVVGLAPGLHGANKTGRPFTGDYAGILLYKTLHKFGFADRDVSLSSDDGMRLIDCRITNAVRCVPPQNKPNASEISNCRIFLLDEIEDLTEKSAILALGRIAHESVLRALGVPLKKYSFKHGGVHLLRGNMVLFDSYHCSRYNTQTKRLTVQMFNDIFESIRHYINDVDNPSVFGK